MQFPKSRCLQSTSPYFQGRRNKHWRKRKHPRPTTHNAARTCNRHDHDDPVERVPVAGVTGGSHLCASVVSVARDGYCHDLKSLALAVAADLLDPVTDEKGVSAAGLEPGGRRRQHKKSARKGEGQVGRRNIKTTGELGCIALCRSCSRVGGANGGLKGARDTATIHDKRN